jgi:hypothetical protein
MSRRGLAIIILLIAMAAASCFFSVTCIDQEIKLNCCRSKYENIMIPLLYTLVHLIHGLLRKKSP